MGGAFPDRTPDELLPHPASFHTVPRRIGKAAFQARMSTASSPTARFTPEAHGRGLPLGLRTPLRSTASRYATGSLNTISQPWNTTARPVNRTSGNCRARRSSAR